MATTGPFDKSGRAAQPESEDLSRESVLRDLPRDAQGRPMTGKIPLLRRLGRGGMGAVYYAVHPRLHSEVAVKVLSREVLSQDPHLADRFLIEARTAASISSEHVVRVLDVDLEGDTHYIVMEYVNGQSAETLLKKRAEAGTPGLNEPEALTIVMAASRGLATAHQKGIIHRDVKPANILLPDGQPAKAKLADLGLAKPEGSNLTLATATMAGLTLGTPGYMAPEQAEDARKASPASDVFSMGATFYALLTGWAPFRGSSLMGILRETMDGNPKPLPPWISPRTREVVERCLRKNPAERYVNADELIQEFRRKPKTVVPRGDYDATLALPGGPPKPSGGAPSTILIGDERGPSPPPAGPSRVAPAAIMTPLPVTSSPSPLPSAPLTPLITPLPTPLPASPTPLPPGATPLPVGQTPVPSSYGAPPSRNRLLVAVLAGGAALVIALLIILKSGPSAEDVMAEKAAQAAIAAAQARAGEGDYDGAVRALEGFDRPAHEALRKEYKRRALERREKEKADLLKRVASLESAGQFADALVLLDKAGTGGDPEVAAARERIEKKEQAIKEDYDKAIQAVTAAQEKAKKESTEKAWRDVKEACDLARARSRTPAEQEQILTWAAQATLNADWSAAKEADQRNELDVAIKHGEKAASTPNAPAELTRYVAELKDRRKKMEEKTSRKQRFDELAARALGERDGDAALKLWAQAQEFADLDADKEKIRTQVAAINARMKSEDVDRKYREAMADGEKSLASESFDVAEKRFREALTIRAEDAAATDGIKRVQARKGQKAYDVATGEARAAEKGGEWDKAKAAWKRAIEARPGDAAAGAALKEIEEPAKIEVVVEAARGIKMEFVHIRPGTFTMGDATGDGNEKVHEVVLTKPFWMQTTEVTQAQWEAVMSVNPSSFKSVAKPVENISWPDAQSCAARMNEKLAPQFRGRTAALPNEAQWEYAARAGGSYRWYFGNDGMKDLKENGWYAGNAQYKTQPVAQKRPNAWGLFDMAGNVAEWCADWYGEYPPTATDPQGASTGLYRVYRGGHWNSQPLDCRSAKRTGETPTARSNFVGVRLILQ